MSEVVDEEVAEAVEEEAPDTEEYSETQLEALEHGWNPEGVEGKRNLSAEEFMDRQKFFDDIRALKKHNKKIQEEFDALKKHHSKVRETERSRLMEELKLKKKLAYEAEDYDSVVELDEQISDLKTEAKEEPTDKETKDASNAVFAEWVGENRWYTSDPDMRAEADTLGNAYSAIHGEDGSLEEMLEYVTKKIKKKFPDQFQNTKRDRAPAVDKATRKVSKGKKSKYSASDLPEEDRRVMQTLVRGKHITEEQYLKEYFGEG